ncbi:MAG TPA: hypothetical protein VGB33_01235 [Acidimicrobiia bacterium]|jgi:hypothetical protein
MVITPRPFGQVLGDAMNGLAQVWRALLMPALAVSVPVSIATVVAFRVTGGAEFMDIVFNSPERLQTISAEVFWALARPFFMAVGLAAVFQAIAGVFIALMSHRAVASVVHGRPISGKAATRHAVRRFSTGLGAILLVLVVVSALIGVGAFIWLVPLLSVGTPNPASVLVAFLLFVALVGPGIWVGVSSSMTTSAVAIESQGVVGSIRRSIGLVSGRWWPTAGFLLLVGLLGGIATQLIQLIALPLAAVGNAGTALTIASALGVFTQGLLIAGITAMYTHWYIDLRSRKETLSTEDLG